MSRFLDELLEMSRIGRVANPAKNIPLAEMVDEALGLVQGPIQKHNVSVSVEQPLPTVFADRLRIIQVFQNLIDNAVKFCAGKQDSEIHIGAEVKENEVICYVRDNGTGIEAKYHDRIFGLFNKLDPHSESTGVGLALVKRIIEVHNGRVWLESEGNDKGTTFYFSLPVTR